MSDELLDKYGNTFIYHNYREVYDLRFDEYITLINHGLWDEFVRMYNLLRAVTLS